MCSNADALPPLHPIIISPLRYSSTTDGKTYTCLGDGLIWDGYKFDPDIESSLPLLEPVRTKKGTIAARQPHIPKRPAPWWRAQCKFRGLSQQGRIEVLQERIRATDNGMIKELATAEQELNAEFRKQNAAARDEEWNHMETDEEKAEADPGRFLQEKFPSIAAVVVKTNSRSKLHEKAAPLGLYTRSADAPVESDGTLPSIDRWIVIGRDRLSVDEKVLEINRESMRARQRAQEASEERSRKKHQTIVQKAKKESVASSSSQKNKSGVKRWNVAGSYDIKCPYVEEQWGGDGKECSLNIHITRESAGIWQMWAEFDFIALQGIFRFVNPTHGSVGAPPAGKGDNGGSDNGDGDEDDDGDSVGPIEFLIPAICHPSPTSRTWPFRWRGTETGEGEIQLYSDKKLCSFTFLGAYGLEIKGMFESDYTEKIGFTGRKVVEEGVGKGRPEDRWRNYSESAYNYASKARWGGW
jgi:hypothetical protein